VQIRPAVHGDEHGIAAVLIASWGVVYEGIIPGEVIESVGARRVDQWRRILAAPPEGTGTFLSEDGAEITGVVMAGAARDPDAGREVGEIYLVYVHPDHWGEGHGAALMVAAFDHLREQGCTGALLWVHPDNARAISFYERSGWAADGAAKDEDVFGARVPHIRYRMRL
jgi:ribosomal protein S18 acetylase RimI-like enzyme